MIKEINCKKLVYFKNTDLMIGVFFAGTSQSVNHETFLKIDIIKNDC